MDAKTHWETIYTTKEPEAVSWYRAHLETSLALIERAAQSQSASIIDIGAGESTLVDDLLARGYENLTVLDISETALDVTKKRIGPLAEQIKWFVADITQIELEPLVYDVWHDRAVFHFLTRCLCRKRRNRCQAGGTRNRQHFRARRSYKMQRTRSVALRCEITA
jgi:SAM-dependent methyltransferase